MLTTILGFSLGITQTRRDHRFIVTSMILQISVFKFEHANHTILVSFSQHVYRILISLTCIL